MTDDGPKKVNVNYPSNSQKKKNAENPKGEKKLEKVISGDVVKRKKPLGRKIAETFVGDDVQSVGHYILFEVMIPAAKTMISDAASQGVERILFGDSSRRRISTTGSRAPISYNRMHSSSSRPSVERPESRTISNRARSNHEFDEIVIDTRAEAEEVLDQLNEVISNFDVATVADLYDLVGITGSFTDDKWGWTDLRGADITRVREGYLLNLPKTRPID